MGGAFWVPFVLALGCAEDEAALGDVASVQSPPAVQASFVLAPGKMPAPANVLLGWLEPLVLGEGNLEGDARLLDDLLGGPRAPALRDVALRIPLSGKVDPQSLNDALFLWDVGEKRHLEFQWEWHAAQNEIRLFVPRMVDDEHGLRPGSTYTFGLLSGQGGVRDENGAAILRDALTEFLLSPNAPEPHAVAEVLSDDGAMVALDAARNFLAPILSDLEAEGLSKKALVSLSVFSVRDVPTIVGNPWQRRVSLPQDLARDPESGRVILPHTLADNPALADLIEPVTSLSAFSTEGMVHFDTTHPLDRNTVETGSVLSFYRVDDPSFPKVASLPASLHPDGQAVIFKGEHWLEPGARYAWVLEHGVKTSAGYPLMDELHATALLMREPLLKEGKSTLSALPTPLALLLEDTRRALFPLVTHLESQGKWRNRIASIGLFSTLDSPGWVMEHRARLFSDGLSTQVSDVLDKSPWDRGLWLAMPKVRTVLSGTMKTLSFLNPETRGYRAEPVPIDVEWVMTLPENRAPGEKIPMVLFGHGLITSRELVYLAANMLADRGYGTFAIDLPFHGERSVCDSDASCAEGICAADGKCVHPDGTPGRFRTFRGPWADGPMVPITTGQAYVDIHDIPGSGAHFLQSAVDLCQALRVIKGADWESVTGGYLPDGDDVVYTGISLGGILGAVLAGVEPGIETFVLNVPGAGLARLLEESDTLGPVLLEELDVQPGTWDYARYRQLAQWSLDLADPINLAHFATGTPLRYTDPLTGEERVMPQKRVLIQMADGDLVVPNESTARLAERTGLVVQEFDPLLTGHGFLLDPTSLEGARARDQLMDFFDLR
jgi:hypothetical protein